MGLALASLVLLPQAALAQGGERPIRRELPGFDISRDGGWRVKARRVAAERARLLTQRDFGRLNEPMRAGPTLSSHAITGTFYVPMVLFYYNDTPPADVRETVEYSALLFGDTPPPGRPYTLKSYYRQLSNDLFTMEGQAIGWARLDSNEVTYTGTGCGLGGNGYCNGINSSDALRRMQLGLREALTKMDPGVDFGRFDNDGDDGLPNSGDDDGYVDMLGLAHATQDGACGGNNHIWAHRWVLLNPELTALWDYVTNDPRNGGGSVRIRDYFIQSALGGGTACSATQLMPIGTAAHEFGHALALPDLYDVDLATEGIGRWGLMGSGNYSSPNSPARMEAWSLNELGWVTIVPLTDTGTYVFGAAQTSDTVFLVDVRGSNPNSEYFLLENRQRALADTALMRNACVVWHQDSLQTTCPGGLLIWHIDGAKLAASGWPNNTVNVGPIHGVKLEEADGARDLWCPNPQIPGPYPDCNRGDAGDPYPGMSNNTAFRFASNPRAAKNANGAYVGFDIDQITQVTQDGAMSFRLTFDTTPALVVQTAPPPPAAVMGTFYTDTLVATGGTGSRSWSLFAGALPLGVTLATNGVLSGRPRATGNFTFTVRVESSDGQLATATHTISVTAPALVLVNVLTRLFDPLAGTLSADQIFYLDYLGNNNGEFDVGDFKAWRDAAGGL